MKEHLIKIAIAWINSGLSDELMIEPFDGIPTFTHNDTIECATFTPEELLCALENDANAVDKYKLLGLIHS